MPLTARAAPTAAEDRHRWRRWLREVRRGWPQRSAPVSRQEVLCTGVRWRRRRGCATATVGCGSVTPLVDLRPWPRFSCWDVRVGRVCGRWS